MKVTIEKPENEKQEIVYPCLMENEDTGTVVLYINPSQGICLFSHGLSEVGEFSSKWTRSHFTPLPKGTKVIITQ